MCRQGRGRRDDVIVWPHQASEVAGIHDTSERLANAAMSRDDLNAVEDHDLVVAKEYLDGPAN